MGQFSFACSACGDKEQFDWTDEVVVALKNPHALLQEGGLLVLGADVLHTDQGYAASAPSDGARSM